MFLGKRMFAGLLIKPLPILGSTDYGPPIMNEEVVVIKDSYIGVLESVYKDKDITSYVEEGLDIRDIQLISHRKSCFWELPSDTEHLRKIYNGTTGQIRYVVEESNLYYVLKNKNDAVKFLNKETAVYEACYKSLQELLRKWSAS